MERTHPEDWLSIQPDLPGASPEQRFGIRGEAEGAKEIVHRVLRDRSADVGSDREFPDVSARDAEVLHELQALGRL